VKECDVASSLTIEQKVIAAIHFLLKKINFKRGHYAQFGHGTPRVDRMGKFLNDATACLGGIR
jgi:hypothetical protein